MRDGAVRMGRHCGRIPIIISESMSDAQDFGLADGVAMKTPTLYAWDWYQNDFCIIIVIQYASYWIPVNRMTVVLPIYMLWCGRCWSSWSLVALADRVRKGGSEKGRVGKGV